MTRLRPFLHSRAIAVIFAVSDMFLAIQLACAAPSASGDFPQDRIVFLENGGRVLDSDGVPRNDVLFTCRSNGVELFFLRDRVSYVYHEFAGDDAAAVSLVRSHRELPAFSVRSFRMDMELVGARPDVRIRGASAVSGAYNAYTPSHPDGIIGLRAYERIIYENVYDGVDLQFYVAGDGVKYDFIVHPYGRAGDIRFRYVGADNVGLNDEGGLLVTNPLGTLLEGAPVSRQDAGEGRTAAPQPAATSFTMTDGLLGFSVPSYDPSTTLTIDPSLKWGTYLGGTNYERGTGIATDASGNTVVCGYTFSGRIAATAGTIQTVNAGDLDAFVAAFNNSGQLLWYTLYGGSGNDPASSIALDPLGTIVVVGSTHSADFPVSAGAFQTAYGNGDDAFVLKLTAAGLRSWATFLGGGYDDQAASVSVHSSQAIAVAGWTSSPNFPVSGGAVQPFMGGVTDAFVIVFNAGGNRSWGTFYGGSYSDGGEAVSFDAASNVIVTGETFSPDFPLSAGAFQPVHHGSNDGFLIKLDGVGALLWSTFIGGSGNDISRSVAVDDSSHIVIAGVTRSSDFPVTTNAFSPYQAGGEDAFMAKFTPAGARSWATYYGGVLNDGAFSVATDHSRNITIAGQTYSPNFPVSPGALYPGKSGTADAIVAKFTPAGTRLWSTFYGGAYDESAEAVAVNNGGSVLLTGWTTSTNLPIMNPHQNANAGNYDVFITKLCDAKPTVNASRSTNLCPGDSVTLETGSWYSGWTWKRNGVAFSTNRWVKVGQAGKYIVAVSDGLGCDSTGVSDTVTVNLAPVLVAHAGLDQDICNGSGTVIGLPADGGVAPLRYAWSPKAGLSDSAIAQPTASPANTTVYTVTVTDAYGCSSFESMLLTVYGRPSVDAGKDTIICHGSSVVIGNVATGGSPRYRYSWSPPDGLSSTTAAQPTASPEVTTTYIVTVHDDNDCIARDTVVVTVDLLALDAGPDRHFCSGDTVTIGAPATGGIGAIAYQWSPASGLSSATVAQPRVFGSGTTRYIVTATDSRFCQAVDTVSVYIATTLTSVGGGDVSVCLGSAVMIGDTAVCGVPPYRYTWTPATGLSSDTIARPIASPSSTQKYHVTVTDASLATAVDSLTVTVHAVPTVEAGQNLSICPGTSVVIGNPASGGTPGYSYLWHPAAGLSSATVAQPLASPDATRLYHVTVTDANGCIAEDSIIVTVYPFDVDAGADQQLCLGDSVRIGNDATGGAPLYSYSWTPSDGLQSVTMARPMASPAVPTVYVVRAFDQLQCTATDTVFVNVLQRPTVNAGRDTTICRYETALLGNPGSAGTPPYTYSWTPATGLNSATAAQPLARPSISTSYIVTITDSKSCRARDTVRVTVRAWPLLLNFSHSVSICRGDSVRIGAYASGSKSPYMYTWTPSPGLSDTAIARPYAKPFFSTTYRVMVTDANGCQSFDSVTVTVPSPPLPLIIAFGPLVFCDGDSVVLDADTARRYNGYRWFKDGVIVSTARQYTARETGLYIAQVNTISGCMGEAPAVQVYRIPLPRPRVTESGSLVFCEGGSIVLECDSANIWSYHWSTGATSRAIRVSASGNYSVTVTDPYGCSGTSPVFPVTVHPKPRPVIVYDGPLTFCTGDSVVLDAGAGYRSYLWNSGSPNRILVVKQSGSYTVAVTDSNGCSGTSPSVSVTVVPLPKPAITASGPLSFCEGGSVTLDAGSGYASYLWSTGAQTRTIVVTTAGTFFVTVTNTGKCTGSSQPVSTTVKAKPRPSITALGPVAFCSGDSVQLDAGAGYASYLWSNGSRNRMITVKTTGNFSVTVTNSDGCSALSAAVTVTVRSKPTPHITAGGSLSFCPGDSVILDAGAGFSSYLWSNGATTRSIIVKASGSFTVTVANLYGCTATSASATTTLYATPKPAITANGPLSFCEGGSVQLDAGAGYASYLWSTGARTRRITVSQGGLYNVTVTNDNGCKGESGIVTVTVLPNPSKPVITRIVNTLTSTIATTYQWNFNGVAISGATARSHTATRNGRYTVTVSNENGCTSTSAAFDVTLLGVEESAPALSFTVFPDPNFGSVTVEASFDSPVDVEIVLTNLLGQKVLTVQEKEVRRLVRTLNTSSLAPGTYLIQMRADNQVVTRRIVKQ